MIRRDFLKASAASLALPAAASAAGVPGAKAPSDLSCEMVSYVCHREGGRITEGTIEYRVRWADRYEFAHRFLGVHGWPRHPLPTPDGLQANSVGIWPDTEPGVKVTEWPTTHAILAVYLCRQDFPGETRFQHNAC